MYKKGFTLAEVLTTLMVIGVVAAMTIPTLMNSTNDQQLKVAYKKSVSVLAQGVKLMTAKEAECVVRNGNELADCFNRYVLSGTRKDDTISTPDGLVYKFIFKKIGGENSSERSIEDICGDAAKLFTTANQMGTNAPCSVIVDLNGFSKGQKSIPEEIGSNNGGAATILAYCDELGAEQQPIMIAGNGAKPMYYGTAGTYQVTKTRTEKNLETGEENVSTETKNVSPEQYKTLNKGYEWLYGNGNH